MLRRFIPSVPAVAHRRFSSIIGSKFILALGGVTRVTLCDQKIVPGAGRGPELSRHRLLHRTFRTRLDRSALESFPRIFRRSRPAPGNTPQGQAFLSLTL